MSFPPSTLNHFIWVYKKHKIANNCIKINKWKQNPAYRNLFLFSFLGTFSFAKKEKIKYWRQSQFVDSFINSTGREDILVMSILKSNLRIGRLFSYFAITHSLTQSTVKPLLEGTSNSASFMIQWKTLRNNLIFF